MKSREYFRFVVFSVGLAILLGLASLIVSNRLNETSSVKFRNQFILFFAQSIEEKVNSIGPENADALKTILEDFRPGGPGFPPPPPMHGSLPPPPPFPTPSGNPLGDRPRPTGPFGGFPRMGPELWLISEAGQVISTNAKSAFPLDWNQFQKPSDVHSISEKVHRLRLAPGIAVIKLDTKSSLFVVVKDPRPIFPFLAGQVLMMFLTVTTAFVLSLTFLFLYLRKKSDEARTVLQRIGKGDLKARFGLKRIDELGGLLVDFNRMAEQIEHLVVHVRETETIRKNLVQELGHDLRTPLTSMRTSFETLKVHFASVSEEERKDLFEIIESEIRYLGELIEKLMLISSLDEPNFKSSTEVIDINEILSFEIRNRQASTEINWTMINGSKSKKYLVQGNSHLLQRLFKNALDNAGKFAKHQIQLSLTEHDSEFEIQILDDGPGVKDEDIAQFGLRRAYRVRRVHEGLNFALGLGSVIMRSIAEIHGGRISISNVQADGAKAGAKLTVFLPKSLSKQTTTSQSQLNIV